MNVVPTTPRQNASFLGELANARDLGAGLHLHERVAAKHLTDRHERLELHDAAAEPLAFLAGRQRDFPPTLRIEPLFEAVKQHPLDGNRHVAKPAEPLIAFAAALHGRAGPRLRTACARQCDARRRFRW